MKKIFLLLIMNSALLFSQNEFQVNTYSDSTQRWPSISNDGNGNYYVVWQSLLRDSVNSNSNIYLQQFNSNDEKIGGEVLVNGYEWDQQEKPVIATNSSGTSVIAWSTLDTYTAYNIHARIFNQNMPAGFELNVNTYNQNSQTNPAVAIRENGEFVIVWDSWYQDGSDRGVYAQLFTADGGKLGMEFKVNNTTLYSQTKPRVKYFSNGNFVVIWESFKQDGSGYGMFGKIYRQTGTAITDEFQINTYTNDYQWFGDIEVFDDNSFIAAWCSWEQDSDDGGIFVQRFDQIGNKIGNETQINKTTSQYQWLPRIKKLTGKNVAVVWSSWKQDGSRDGIIAAFIDENNQRYTFETIVNTYSESFQWEPDFIVTDDDELLIVWSSWEQFGNDYDIVAKRVKLKKPEGVIDPIFNLHPAGKSSAKFLTHVVDSTALIGHTYRISFDVPGSSDTVYAKIEDQNSPQIKVANFPINKGLNTFYLTSSFDGVAVEFFPQFKLELDINHYFVNNSGSNLVFSNSLPTAGQKLLAPIDVALIWGSTDTLATGQYASPSDTALTTTGQKTVLVPFIAKNITDNNKITILIKELTATKNLKWDPKEEIVFITPPPYQVTSFNTHAQVNSTAADGIIILPSIGDTNFILTKRPISEADTFYFTTNKANIIAEVTEGKYSPEKFQLFQNYPNPFNPTTSINFTIPNYSEQRSHRITTLKIFDILGREITTLVNEEILPGSYSITFDSQKFNLASGVYFYQLKSANFTKTKKMLLLR